MKKIILATLTFAPVIVMAQSLTAADTLIRSIGRLVNLSLPVIVGIGLLAFFWGLVKYIFAAGDEAAKADGKKIMIWGLVALFMMVAVWGLVKVIATNLGVDLGATINVPTVPGLL
jgi:hypothetical protein